MNEIIEVQSIEWLTTDSDGTIHYTVTAVIADMRELRPAIYHPADLAEPAELGPGLCSARFSVEEGDPHPPIMGSHYDQVQYLDNLDLEFTLDNES
jgi:hypothetical protein